MHLLFSRELILFVFSFFTTILLTLFEWLNYITIISVGYPINTFIETVEFLTNVIDKIIESNSEELKESLANMLANSDKFIEVISANLEMECRLSFETLLSTLLSISQPFKGNLLNSLEKSFSVQNGFLSEKIANSVPTWMRVSFQAGIFETEFSAFAFIVPKLPPNNKIFHEIRKKFLEDILNGLFSPDFFIDLIKYDFSHYQIYPKEILITMGQLLGNLEHEDAVEIYSCLLERYPLLFDPNQRPQMSNGELAKEQRSLIQKFALFIASRASDPEKSDFLNNMPIKRSDLLKGMNIEADALFNGSVQIIKKESSTYEAKKNLVTPLNLKSIRS